MNSAGSVVADGNYNLQFKIYEGGSGAAVGNPDGVLKWTETHANNGTSQGIKVKNGLFSVSLGSINQFRTQVNWDHDKLWLSMNVAGRADNCTNFGTSPCAADGEMLPMKQITATPYALNAGALNGLSADSFVQLGQGVQTDSSDGASLSINKTGSGDLIQLQNNGSDVFTVKDDGSLTLGGGSDKSISIATSPDDTPGSQLAISAGSGGAGSGSEGGNLVLAGGSAGGTDANGGNIVLSGGAGSGIGASGLVIIGTPTFSTATSDASCYAGGGLVSSSCTVSQSSVDNSAAVIVGFSASGQTATVPAPTIQTPGRIIYVIAADDSRDFSLSFNQGEFTRSLNMQPSTAATLIWNGTSWVTIGGSSATSLQDVYDNSDSGEIALSQKSNDSGGLTVRNDNENPVDNTLLQIQNSSADPILSVNTKVTDSTEHASDGGVNDPANFGTNWTSVGDASVSRITSDGQEAGDSVEVVTGTSAASGVRNHLAIAPAADTNYKLSVYAKLTAGSEFNDFSIRYSPDGGANFINCSDYSSQSVALGSWTKISCNITTDQTVASDPLVYFTQAGASENARTFLVDAFSMTREPSPTQNVKVGNNSGGDKTTLFTVDKADSAPTAKDSNDLLGSMYYDTTLGKLQCYEAEGWGACGASPDTFVTISPEYSGAVMNGADVGTISSGLCSDALNINDGSGDQPAICGTDEIYNFYNWTSEEATAQTRSIFVTYQLPDNFKEFVPDSTSLIGRTDDSDASLTYQIYRDSSSGLSSCGSAITVSSGTQNSWQKVAASGAGDPTDCGFEAGDNIYFRINLTAANNANAYASSLKFIFSNN